MNYSENKITAVIGAYRNPKRTIAFVNDFHKRFPDVPVSLGIVGNTREDQNIIEKEYEGQPWIKVISGTDQRVSFSETWNAAISGITTERFVFLHNDMYVHDRFFWALNKQMDEQGPSSFYLYTTVEPLENQGFVRPGKIVASFGHDLEDFEKEEFNAFASKYIFSHTRYADRGYGFYLAGFTESLKDVGGFDSKSFFPVFCEDDDLNLRIRIKGYVVHVAHQALVYHFVSKTLRLETPGSMSDVEIESNRHFARKWGFEARYLWTTAYERIPEVRTGSEFLVFESPAHRGIGPELSELDILNVEPLADALVLTPNEIEITREYFKTVPKHKAFTDMCPNPDIIVCPVQGHNFVEFANLIGSLRFYHRYLGVGEGQAGKYLVTVLHTGEDRVDITNYLSESVTNE